MTEHPIERRVAEQTAKNLDLTKRFIDKLLEDDSALDDVPAGTRLVLISPDDPEQASRNFELAVREMMHGRRVAMRLVGGLTPELEAWRQSDVRNIFMHEIRFPTKGLHAEGVRLVYDQPRDTLLVDYFDWQRSPVRLVEISPNVILRIEEETYEIVGYLLASFLQREALRSPALIRALRKAEMRSLTDEELGDVEIVRGGEEPFDDDEAAAVATAFLTTLAPRRLPVERRRDRDSA
jgi:hypothetical protein